MNQGVTGLIQNVMLMLNHGYESIQVMLKLECNDGTPFMTWIAGWWQFVERRIITTRAQTWRPGGNQRQTIETTCAGFDHGVYLPHVLTQAKQRRQNDVIRWQYLKRYIQRRLGAWQLLRPRFFGIITTAAS